MNYYIITMSKAHHKITEQQKNNLMRAEASQVELEDGSIVKINSIAEIIPENKYFQTFPDKRPAEERNYFEGNAREYNAQIRKPTKHARELMQKGFVKQQIEAHGISKEDAIERFNRFTKKRSWG